MSGCAVCTCDTKMASRGKGAILTVVLSALRTPCAGLAKTFKTGQRNHVRGRVVWLLMFSTSDTRMTF